MAINIGGLSADQAIAVANEAISRMTGYPSTVAGSYSFYPVYKLQWNESLQQWVRGARLPRGADQIALNSNEIAVIASPTDVNNVLAYLDPPPASGSEIHLEESGVQRVEYSET